MIIPRGAENLVAIDLIVQHIQEILRTPPRQISDNESDEKSFDLLNPKTFDKSKISESCDLGVRRIMRLH